jgi:hypothetical protein
LTFFCNARGFETDLTNHSEAPGKENFDIPKNGALEAEQTEEISQCDETRQ